MNHTGFLKGMLLGAAAGAAADMVLHTRTGRRTAAGKAMQSATDAVDSARDAPEDGASLFGVGTAVRVPAPAILRRFSPFCPNPLPISRRILAHPPIEFFYLKL